MKYQVLVGLNYCPHGVGALDEKRAEPGEVVDDLPAGSVAWLLDQRCIAEVEDTPAPAATAEGGRP